MKRYMTHCLCNREDCYQSWWADDEDHVKEQFWDYWNSVEDDVVELKKITLSDGEVAKGMLDDFLEDRRNNDDIES